MNALLSLLRRLHARRSVVIGLFFALVVCVGPFAFEAEATAQHTTVSLGEGIYATLGLFGLQGNRFGYPHTALLQALYFLAPTIAASAVIGAFVRLLEERGPILFQRMSGHTVVGGLGNLGSTVAQDAIRRGTRFIAIERNPEAPQVRDMRAQGHAVVTGDVVSTEALRLAGCLRASKVFFTTSSDIANLDAAFHVRRMARAEGLAAAPRVFVHVYDQGLAEAIRQRLRSHEAGEADIITFNSYRFAAKALIAVLLRDRLVGSLRVGAGLTLERTAWTGKTGEPLHEPHPHDRGALLAEDRRRLSHAFRLASEPSAGGVGEGFPLPGQEPAAPPEERFAIVGLGRFGRSVARELLTTVSANARFLVVERAQASAAAQLATFGDEERRRFDLFVGDAGAPEAIARIKDFEPRAVIICTDSDLGNLRVALDLHQRNIRTVTRMFDLEASQELAHGLEACGIATVGLARLFCAAIPILTHERRLRACLNLDVQQTPAIDHLFYLADLDPEERRDLGDRCVPLSDLPRAAGAPEPPAGLALVWHRAVEELRRVGSRDA